MSLSPTDRHRASLQPVRFGVIGTVSWVASLCVVLTSCAGFPGSETPEEVRGLTLVEDVQDQPPVAGTESPEPTTLGVSQTAENQAEPVGEQISTTRLIDGWPPEYPLPPGVEIVLSSRREDDGEINFTTSFVGSLSFEETVGHFAVIYPETDELAGEPGERRLVQVFENSPSRLLTIEVDETETGSRGTISINGYWQDEQ